MVLDILVPKYKETEKDLTNLLTSIVLQQGISFNQVRVRIGNDGGSVINKKWLEQYPCEIAYYDFDHCGVSSTRNRLLDLSDGDYIMCCDADDMFSDMLGLSYIFKAMDKGFDVFNSVFYEETKLFDGGQKYIRRSNDTHFVHGKVFRRQYLIDNNIRWKDEFLYSGDSYFLGLALRTSKQHIYCSTPFYIWKWNPDSICRREKNHYEKEFGMKLKVTSALIDELLVRGMTEDARYFALFVVYDAYYIMQSDGWEAMDDSDRNSRIEHFREFYRKYEDLMNGADRKMRMAIIRVAKNNQFVRGNIMEKITYGNWLKQTLG